MLLTRGVKHLLSGGLIFVLQSGSLKVGAPMGGLLFCFPCKHQKGSTSLKKSAKFVGGEGGGEEGYTKNNTFRFCVRISLP